jgi:hypothetical protein
VLLAPPDLSKKRMLLSISANNKPTFLPSKVKVSRTTTLIFFYGT